MKHQKNGNHLAYVLWMVGLFFVAVRSGTEGIAADSTAKLLKAAEIRQYEGRDLSSD